MASRSPRIARRSFVVLAGLGAGTAIAIGVGDDITSAWRRGHVTPVRSTAAFEHGPSAERRDEVADGYGFSLAQQIGARTDNDCGRLAEVFRRGCRNWLRHREERRQAGADGPDLSAAPAPQPAD